MRLLSVSYLSHRLGLSLSLAIIVGGCGGAPIERHGDAQQRVVSRSLAAGLKPIRDSVMAGIRQTSVPSAIPFRKMRVVELKQPDYTTDWVTSFVDPGEFLKPYKDIDIRTRATDLFIEEPTFDEYWLSEYRSASGPVKFRCGFILHFKSEGSTATDVQVFEKVPEVWVGEKWSFSRHGFGFGKIHDIRFVEPTVKDRVDMLNAVEALLLSHL